jgi:hypothetical protein
VAGLLAELGPLSFYQNAKQLIKMAGTNPTESESAGKRGSRTLMSKKGCPSLRWCIWAAALSLLWHNPDFHYWAQQREEHPAHAHPLEKANRLLRLAYALMRKQTLYKVPQMVEITA